MVKQQPHYLGHRDRLKQRFRERGANSLADYELLELLLTYAIPRKDVKPIAKNLLKDYNTLSNIFSSSLEELKQCDGLGESSATFLKLIAATAIQYRRDDITEKDILANKLDLIDYLYTQMSGKTREEFRVIFLSSKNHILADEVLFTGTLNSSAVYPREVIKAALDKGAAGIVLAHNHPSGSPDPSPEDECITLEIAALAQGMGILVHDHIIIGDGAHFSFKDSGKL